MPGIEPGLPLAAGTITVLVRVEWWDTSGSREAWLDKEDAAALRPVLCHTVGTVLYRSKAVLVLAATVGEHGQVGDVIAIPMGCVKRVRRL
jgi:hypothetical protein